MGRPNENERLTPIPGLGTDYEWTKSHYEFHHRLRKWMINFLLMAQRCEKILIRPATDQKDGLGIGEFNVHEIAKTKTMMELHCDLAQLQ